jgi:hypothetical protein
MTINFDLMKQSMPYKTKEITSKKTGNKHKEHYITARDVQAVLDEACGPENWQSEFYKIGDTLFCRIGIRVNGEWVWKSDCGESSDISPEKGEASDAFKRAAVMWGVGRFLYSVTGEYRASKYTATTKPADQPAPDPTPAKPVGLPKEAMAAKSEPPAKLPNPMMPKQPSPAEEADALVKVKQQIWGLAKKMGLTEQALADTSIELVNVPLSGLTLALAQVLFNELKGIYKNQEALAV